MQAGHEWTLFSNHGHVLICLAGNPEQPLREVALAVGITERAVQRIVSELEEAGYIGRQREGRRNKYQLHEERTLRHPLERTCTIGKLLGVVVSQRGGTGPSSDPSKDK